MADAEIITEEQSPNGTKREGREKNGRFVKGCKPGPGNPYLQRMMALRSSLYNAIEKKDIHAVIRSMVAKAIEGDVQAAKLILGYVVSQPAEIGGKDDDDDSQEKVRITSVVPRAAAMIFLREHS